MKSRNRNVEIFSMSALDLFASAMGAFVLLAIILLPYYRMKAPTLSEVNKLKVAVEDLQEETQDLKKAVENAQTFAFLGIVSKSNKFVLVIDMSGSMAQNPEHTALMDKTLKQVIGGMSDKHFVQMIGYQGNAPTPKYFPWKAPRDLGNAKNEKSSAISYVNDLANDYTGGTPTLEALEEALKYDAECIILLSDGEPNTDAQNIVSRITSLNAGKKEIHSVAIGDFSKKPEFVSFLSDLALKNGGQFVGVSH